MLVHIGSRSGYTEVYLATWTLTMFLEVRENGHMVEVLDVEGLYNPFRKQVNGRCHYGEEMQDPELFSKGDLQFLSGEPLPLCWVDVHYRDDQIHH